jgi:ubiquitin-protein ligase
MSNLSLKRVMLDMRNFQKANVERDGIYCHFNESNLMNVKAMIIGPTETPYTDGFYFFDITFPDNYPMSPPSVIYHTVDGNVRFNPNLYANGKVCLSIINTWDGPKWVPCQSLLSVLLSIQSMILVSDPLRNEPCYYECKERATLDPYNKAVEYENYRIAIGKMLRTPPHGFDVFLPIMRQHFVKNRDRIIARLTEMKKMKNERYQFGFYAMYTNTNYESLFNDISTLLSEIVGEYPELLIEQANASSSSSASESAPTASPVAETAADAPEVSTPAVAMAAAAPAVEQKPVKKIMKKKVVKKSVTVSSPTQSPTPSIEVEALPVALPPKVFIKASMRMKLDELIQLCEVNNITIKVSKKKEILEQIQEHNHSINNVNEDDKQEAQVPLNF